MRPVSTALDFSLANSLAARRRVADVGPHAKLAILRRLMRQFVAGTLPRYSESNIEQSWNEQVFAAVLGYQTQFSHDRLPFHMKAKNFQAGYFSDFSLGHFGVGTDDVKVTAELKGPLVDLDKPQSKKYGRRTPVQQAFRTAQAEPGCQWVLVSNFVEVRLYHVDAPTSPVAQAWLPDIVDTLHLARLQAVLDRKALLGDGRQRGELLSLMSVKSDHPSSVIEAEEDQYRVVLRFTPRPEKEVPLFIAEQGLLDGIKKAPGWFHLFRPPGFGLRLLLRSQLADGWVAVDGGSEQNGVVGRVAVSLLGQVQASFRFRAPKHRDGQVERSGVEFIWILNSLRFFGGLLGELYPMANTMGLFAAELREAKDKFMMLSGELNLPRAPNAGVAEIDEILAGDFDWNGAADTLTNMEATCACELAAYFRSENGGVGANLDAVRGEIEKWNAHDANSNPES